MAIASLSISKVPQFPLHRSPFSRFRAQTLNHDVPVVNIHRKTLSLLPTPTRNLGIPGKLSGLLCSRKLIFSVNAENGKGESGSCDGIGEAERVARGDSTMPERFRSLYKEAPDPPVRWPYFVALAFLIYAWRAVLFELSNWRKGVVAVVRFVGYLLKLFLALVFHFIGDPITSVIRCVETAFYVIRAYYSRIVAYAPVPELTTLIILASAVIAIAEAAVPNSLNQQPYLLTFSGIVGYAAVRGYISEPFFWTLLFGMYSFSRFFKQRDDVSSAMPVAAVLAAIGEPWVRVIVIASYLALAICHHSRKLAEGKEEGEYLANDRGVPLPLFGVALAIGIRLAAKWAGYRHLTWMIV